jgi:hypothetical protein
MVERARKIQDVEGFQGLLKNKDGWGRSWSVRLSSRRFRPSKEHHAVLRLSTGTTTLSTMESGTNSGRKDRVCGQIGEIKIAGISGWTRDPPADNFQLALNEHVGRGGFGGVAVTEYAVEPVGVAMTRPSAITLVKCSSSPYNSNVLKNGFGPRSYPC